MNTAKMLPLERKKVALIAKYAVEAFTAADWLTDFGTDYWAA